MNKLSVVIISKNEEKNIRRTLESVKWADEIVLIDSQSEDKTVSIALEYDVKVFSPQWTGYGPAKKAGVDHTSHNWILSVDADEVVSLKLKDEIQQLLQTENLNNGYFVPRKTNFLGRWINHSGWYPDYVLRLFDKTKGNFNEVIIHEEVIVPDPVGYLKNDLLHYSYPDLHEYFRKFNIYTTVGADELYRQGKKTNILAILIKPNVAFIKHYIFKKGILDGFEGFLVSFYSSLAVMVKYVKLYKLYRNGK